MSIERDSLLKFGEANRVFGFLHLERFEGEKKFGWDNDMSTKMEKDEDILLKRHSFDSPFHTKHKSTKDSHILFNKIKTVTLVC